MRPIRLEMEGFTAFRSKTTLDFEDLDLFAITGPTGAGKSSIIDAICYALYGRIPRIGNEMGRAISLGMQRMQVSLEFRANSRAFRVYREARTRGAGRVRLELLEGEDWQPVADGATDVNGRVIEVVGLDFNAFTRSFLLPQGEFQEFLSGKPEERRLVLDKLLRIDVYGRMATKAGQEATSLQAGISEIERRLAEMADATPETRDRLKAELKQVEAEAARLEVLCAALQEGLQLARELSNARTALTQQQTAQQQAADRLAAAQTLMEGGDERLKKIRDEIAAVREQIEAHPFDDSFLEALTAAAGLAVSAERAARSLREAEERLPKQEKEAATAKKIADNAAKAAAEATKATQVADTAVLEAGRHNLAAMLQSGLKVGDPCPICGGVIGELADVSGSDLDEAQRTLLKAKQQEQSALSTAAGSATRAAVAENNLANDRANLERLRATVEEDVAKLEAALPGMADRSSPTINAAVQAQRNLKQERENLIRDERGLVSTLSKEEASLHSALEERAIATAQLDAAVAGVAAAKAREAATIEQLGVIVAKYGWTEASNDLAAGRNPGTGMQQQHRAATDQLAASNQTRGSLQTRIAAIERDIERARDLRADLQSKKAAQNVATDLAWALRATNFQAYIQRQALQALAEDGSRKLLELSSGRYELEVAEAGQDFMVKDRWNADDLRSVRTLSGGETFLASLSLALALAETLPGLAPGRRLALESIFLDEGFGSLDPEALSLAANALDALRTNENRLVCVVTHLKELAERMPARVVVTKTEEGSSVAVDYG